jgi:phage terminase large subunit-like protein
MKLSDAPRYDVREVAYDPWRFHSEVLRLERDHGLLMVEFPQSHARLTVASEGLRRAIVERHLRHCGFCAPDRHIASAVARQTGRGWRLDKADRSAQVDRYSWPSSRLWLSAVVAA